MDWTSWPPAPPFVLRVITLVGATVIVAIGASVAKRAIQVAHLSAKKERDASTWMALVGGFVVAVFIVAVGYRLFSSGYFFGYQ